jgi:integrase/recombinase XerC
VNLVEASVYHERTLERLNRSPQTLRLYRCYENSFMAFLTEHDVQLTLDALNPQFVREWQPWLRSRSTGRRGGIVSEKTGVVTLKTWSRFLWDNEVLPVDPLARLKVPRVQKIQRKPFTQDEATRLVQAASAAANPIRDRALLLMLFDTGCRIGELCAATVADVDLVGGSITFTRTKNGHPRTVRFIVQNRRDGGSCLAALRNWLKVREARPGVESLFTTRERLPLSTRRARELFVEFGQAAHVPGASPHRCRHTAATEFMAERPGAEIQLRSRLGQISHGVLSDYVSQSDPTAIEAAGVASLSTKWNLGSGRPQPKPRTAPEDIDLQDLAQQLARDPALRLLLQQLLNNRGGA